MNTHIRYILRGIYWWLQIAVLVALMLALLAGGVKLITWVVVGGHWLPFLIIGIVFGLWMTGWAEALHEE